MADKNLQLFAHDPDQEARRSELATFFGPRADLFLKTYDAMRAQVLSAEQKQGLRFFQRSTGIVWPAFFFGPVWFFYRKMWAWAWSLVGIMVVLSFIPLTKGLGLPIGLGLAAVGRRAYVDHAMKRLLELRAQGPLTPETVAAAGGVSRTAGWIAGAVYGLLILLGLLAAIYLIQHGQELPH